MEPPMKLGLVLTFRAGIITAFHLFYTPSGMPGLSTLIRVSPEQGPGAGVEPITDINHSSLSRERNYNINPHSCTNLPSLGPGPPVPAFLTLTVIPVLGEVTHYSHRSLPTPVPGRLRTITDINPQLTTLTGERGEQSAQRPLSLLRLSAP